MGYIDYSYYSIDYKGVLIDDRDAFERLTQRASEIIDQMTNDSIHNIGFDHFHTRIQDNIKKATAAQVEFMFLNGGAEMIHESNGITNASIGSFSYSESSSEHKAMSQAAINYLRFTGLMYRGVNVIG